MSSKCDRFRFEGAEVGVGYGITWLLILSDEICLLHVVNRGNNNIE
jgi:hypothetical protein